MTRFLGIIFGAVFVLGGWWFLPQSVEALTISPIRVELAADPGGEASGSFKLFNELTTTQTYYIKFVKFETKDETGEPAFVRGSDGLPSWVTAPSSVEVPPKEFLTVDFEINVPRDVDPGGYFAGILATKNVPSAEDEGDIALESQVGSLILFRVNGAFTEGETILSFNTTKKKSMFSSLPVEFEYRFQNSGEDRVKPVGDITIRNLFGFTSKVIDANRTGGSVLPRSIRRYTSAWVTSGGDRTEQHSSEVSYAPDDLSYFETLKWQWNHFALGRYTATLQFTVNNDAARHYTEALSFWVFPWQLITTILIAVVLVGGLLLGVAVIIALFILKRTRS